MQSIARMLFSLIVFAALVSRVRADVTDAVIRIPSHGASATVIWTGPGRTLILGCGHAYQGSDRNTNHAIDCPFEMAKGPQNVGIHLLAVDYEADLSLVQLNAGPLPYVAPVAEIGHKWGKSLQSCGYDNMRPGARGRPQVFPAHWVASNGTLNFTKERPWHGRSGGGLIDGGVLVGVCSGYEKIGQRRGIYVGLKAIQKFLTDNGYAELVAGGALAAHPPSPQSSPAPRVSEHPGLCPPGRP